MGVNHVFRAGAVLLLALSPAPAQDLFPRHYLSGGMGTGMPRGEINTFFSNRFGTTVNYGYRFHRYFQADIGYDLVFGAAQIRDTVNTALGTLQIRDRQHFLPFGGRGIMPLWQGRILIGGGGGGVYLRYQESIPQPNPNFRVACPYCIGRGGLGGYALLSAKFSNRWQRYWFGVTTKVIRGGSQGEPFGGLPVTRTKDHWINTFAEAGFAF
jgi:hypothetical protein